MKKHIPNAITCLNLLAGCWGIAHAFEGRLVAAANMIVIAALFDFIDGFAARLLKASSPIGKELDSLADVISFGVLPGMIIYQMISYDVLIVPGWHTEVSGNDSSLKYLGFVIPVFSALRLAKFNIDERQTHSFIGLPTPANALMIASFPLILFSQFYPKSYAWMWSLGYYTPEDIDYEKLPDNFWFNLFTNEYALAGIAVAMSLLLVSNLPLFALKFKTFDWQRNKMRYLFLICVVVLLFMLKFIAVPLIVALYIIMSAIDDYVLKTVND